MEKIYDSMENEVDLMTKRIASFKIGERLDMIDSKIEKLTESLKEVDFSSNTIFKEGGEVIKFIEKLKYLTNKLGSKGQALHSKLHKNISRTISKQRNVGIFSSSAVIIFIIVLFVVILGKLNGILERGKSIL